MMHVILLVLKAIGFLLLAVVLLVLLLVLTVLFVPVRYKIKASVLEKKPDVSVRVTWLLHLLSVRAEYHPGEPPFLLEIRLLGMTLGKEKKKKQRPGGRAGKIKVADSGAAAEKKEKAAESGLKPEQKTEKAETIKEPTSSKEESGSEESPEAPVLPAAEENGQDTAKQGPPDDIEEPDWSDIEDALKQDLGQEPEEKTTAGSREESEEASSFWTVLRMVLSRLRNLARSLLALPGKIQAGAVNLAEKKNKAMAFVQDADNQALFRLLWKQTGGIFGHIRPRKLRLYLHFGFEDPYITGKVLGYVSMFYAYYHKTAELVPEFDKQILEGSLYARGRVRAARFVYAGIRLLLNKGCRGMIKKALSK